MNLVACLRCLVFVTVFGQAFGQDFSPPAKPPSESTIETWLLSKDPQSVAWGAQYAFAAGDQALGPVLISLAGSWQSPAGSDPDADHPDGLAPDRLAVDQRDAMAAVLDALIQMHVHVPAGTLRNLSADFPNYVAILLTRLPLEESQSLDFEFYRSEPKSRSEHNLQYVSAVLLAQTPAPRFAAELFSDIHNRATIFITKPGSKPLYTSIGGTAGCCGPEEPRKDWPNFGVYTLSEDKMDEAFVVVAGANPVYGVRAETTHYHRDSCANFSFAVLGPEQRRSLIAQMLNIAPDAIDWKNTAEANIEFKSDQQFNRDLLLFIAAQQKEYRMTAGALVAKNLMTVSEQEDSLPYIDLSFEDQRGAGYSPIAQPSSLPFHVTWPNDTGK